MKSPSSTMCPRGLPTDNEDNNNDDEQFMPAKALGQDLPNRPESAPV